MFRSYRLERVPQDSTLQAWNAADELFIQRYATQELGPVLLLNDSFGALSMGLTQHSLDYWNDSAMAIEALQRNCESNGLQCPQTLKDVAQFKRYNSVVLQIPKSVNYFAYLLELAATHLSKTGTVYVLGMVKHISTGHIKTMNQLFSQVNPGRAEKKARVATLQYPTDQRCAKAQTYHTDTLNLSLTNYPGCYGAGGLDQGARVLINHRADMSLASPVLDMACGNGVLSLALLQQNPTLEIDLVDESQQALASARFNLEQHFPSNTARYFHSNGLNNVPTQNYPLIVCNPPFHQENTVTETIATKLFADLQRQLTKSGECWIVANRHLGYQHYLQKIFSRVDLMSKDPKFNVFRCQK